MSQSSQSANVQALSERIRKLHSTLRSLPLERGDSGASWEDMAAHGQAIAEYTSIKTGLNSLNIMETLQLMRDSDVKTTWFDIERGVSKVTGIVPKWKQLATRITTLHADLERADNDDDKSGTVGEYFSVKTEIGQLSPTDRWTLWQDGPALSAWAGVEVYASTMTDPSLSQS